MTLWSAWYDEVLPDIPAVTQPVAQNAIKQAAIEFCSRSRVYRAEHAPINAAAGQKTYAYVPPVTGTKIVAPLVVWYNGLELTPKTEYELRTMYVNWPAQTGSPIYFFQDQLEKFRPVPFPNADLTGGFTLRVALRPDRTATGIDDTIYERYLDAITSGAKARLYLMKRKPWTDGELAAFHKTAFDTAVILAKVEGFRGWVRSRPRVRQYYF